MPSNIRGTKNSILSRRLITGRIFACVFTDDGSSLSSIYQKVGRTLQFGSSSCRYSPHASDRQVMP